MRVCAVAPCKNKGVHTFPTDEIMRSHWIKATKIDVQRKIGWNLRKFSYICPDHFLPSDYISTTHGIIRRLNRTAVPSVFPWTQPSEIVAHIPTDIVAHTPRDIVAHTARDIVAHTPRDIVAHTPRDFVAHTARDIVAHTPSDILTHTPRDIVARASRNVARASRNVARARGNNVAPKELSQVNFNPANAFKTYSKTVPHIAFVEEYPLLSYTDMTETDTDPLQLESENDEDAETTSDNPPAVHDANYLEVMIENNDRAFCIIKTESIS